MQTASSGGPAPIGYYINPFTTAVFGSGNRTLDFGGGTIADNMTWFPGTGVSSLWLDVTSNSAAPLSEFTLTQAPQAVPEPTALISGLVVASLALIRRR